MSGNGTGPIQVVWGPRVNNSGTGFVTWDLYGLQARPCCVWRHPWGRHPAGGPAERNQTPQECPLGWGRGLLLPSPLSEPKSYSYHNEVDGDWCRLVSQRACGARGSGRCGEPPSPSADPCVELRSPPSLLSALEMLLPVFFLLYVPPLVPGSVYVSSLLQHNLGRCIVMCSQ